MTKRFFTEDEKEYIKKNYPRKTPEEIANYLGVKKQNLIAYAHRHGISNNRYWTKNDEQYIETNFGHMTTASMAKKLGKTQRQVIDKINKNHAGNFLENCENLCLAEVCRLVGRDKETIKRTWFKRGLKWRKRGKYTMIKPSELFDFMKNNTCYWNARDCEEWFFKEFDWFQKKQEEERQELFEKRWGRALKELEGK